MPDQKTPTLKTISEMTGLSLSTVSLSLRDGARLKKETREKVARAAAEIGYVPNRAGVRLRTGQTFVLTLILATDKNNLDFTRMLVQGIGARLEGTPYHLNVIPELDGHDPLEAVRYTLQNKTSDGVILTHTLARDPRVQMLMDWEVPFVTYGRTEFFSPHAYFDFDSEGFVALAIERMAAKGRNRFLLATEDNGKMNFHNVRGAFNRTIAERGLDGVVASDPAAFADAAATRTLGREETSAGRDAIICINELTAISIVGGAEAAGARLGREYDLICKKTTEILPALYPEMETVPEDLFATGQALADHLIRRIRGAEPEAAQALHPARPGWTSGL